MECYYHNNLILLLCVVVLASTSIWCSHGQISTACTNSVLNNFTPCFNFITGSTSNGGSVTKGCCESLKSIMTDSVDCGCLIITGSVPIPIPTNAALAISLPKICQSIGTTIPIQCHATAISLPAPGPALFVPSSSPKRPGPAPEQANPPTAPSPKVSKAIVSDTPVFAPAPAMSPSASDTHPLMLAPTVNPQDIHRVVRPSQSSSSARSCNPWLMITILPPIVGTLFFRNL